MQCQSDSVRKYHENNKASVSATKLAYQAKNKEAHNLRQLEYARGRMQTDVEFRLKSVLRVRLRKALEGKGKKVGSAVKDLGCSLPDFRKHIEALWYSDMTWANLGAVWQLDHVKALGLFDLTLPEEFRAANHYLNIQPLTVADHAAKTQRDRELIRQKRLISLHPEPLLHYIE